jgi:RNA polymerase sigma factor (sigma-70 family)
MLQHATDEELVLFFVHGNALAFEVLQHRYYEWALDDFLFHAQEQFNTCREDAEDFCQEFFIKVVKELQEEDHEFAPGLFEHWIKKLCKNFVIDWERRQHMLFEPLDDAAEKIPGAETKPHASEFWITLGLELRRLPQKKRLIFILYHFKEWKFREIALRLRTTPGAISREYGRILATLKKGRLRFFL